MPDESDRIIKNKTIRLPSGATVKIPVIARISFTDAIDRYQETQVTIDNSDQSNRDVHIAWVGGDNATEEAPGGSAPDGSIAVERIDLWRAIDALDRYQETHTSLDNRTYDPNGPPYFINHLKTHVVRYINIPDNGDWVESELIDQFSFIDAADRYQETIYQLENPPGIPDDEGHLIVLADASTPDITGGEGIDPPYRTDPFQNIVKFGDNSNVTPFFQTYGEFVPGTTPFGGTWLTTFGLILPPSELQDALANGFAEFVGTRDMRMVEQYFEPHTYDHHPTYAFTTGPDTDGIHGYTFDEWSTQFNPGGIWYDAYQDWKAHPTNGAPLAIETYYPDLIALGNQWWQDFIDSGNIFATRRLVWLRWVVIQVIDGERIRS